MKKVGLVALVLAVSLPALAQTPVILAGPPQHIRLLPGQNLTQAMQLVGCDPGWLAAVVGHNKIPVDALGTLGFGLVYPMPPGVDCRQTPPADMVAMSKSMVATRAANARTASVKATVSALEADVSGLKADLEQARGEHARALADAQACAADKTSLASSLAANIQKVTEERDDVRTVLAARWPAWLTFLTGFVVATAGAGAWVSGRRFLR